MNHLSLFSSGLEVADSLVTSGLLRSSWDAILDTQKQFHPFDSTTDQYHCVKCKVHQYPPNGIIVAFVSSPQNTLHHFQTQATDLISSQQLKLLSFNHFDFVATKVNPFFSIQKTAFLVFSSLLTELTLLRNQLGNSSSPLIITGHDLGGSIASLFTLWLLDTILPSSSKRPLCITFGSPLLGDMYFQRAISERPTWNSSFFHVVSNKDVVPHSFLLSATTSTSTSVNIAYRPFGTNLLCSESGCACFEEPESILELLLSMRSNLGLQITDYGLILEHLVRILIFRGVSQVDNSMTNLEAGIVMQLKGIGVETQLNGGGLNSLTRTIVERARKALTQKNKMFDPSEKLTNRKIDLTYLEWYKKLSEDQGGYYDSYKNKQPGTREQSKSREQIIKRHRALTQYWKRMVTEVEQMPQKEGANFRLRWLYGGTNYRRMVEPLDIADYYKKGLKDYVGNGRSQHYIMLEKWFNEDRPVEGTKVRNYACSLTEDSCFWAHVEEALNSIRSMELDMQLSRERLIVFEHYAMNLIKNFAVSPEIFLPKSSFMQWWEGYNVIVGNSYESALCDFMRNHYRNYA